MKTECCGTDTIIEERCCECGAIVDNVNFDTNNAQNLIAAAPEMLEALKILIASIKPEVDQRISFGDIEHTDSIASKTMPSDEGILMALKAIAKAENHIGDTNEKVC